ncbi:hypothetical protein IJ556_01760, partial [bacterium]|nr:hypothetical protein [bacterium]
NISIYSIIALKGLGIINMSTVNTVTSSILAELLKESVTEKLQSLAENNESFADKLAKLSNRSLLELPSIVDINTLKDLKEGKFDISLRQYTNLHTYNLMMSNLYDNTSANVFQKSLNNLLGTEENDIATAKTFVDTMRERGLSNQSAITLYSALKSYSLTSSIGNYNFVDAKI